VKLTAADWLAIFTAAGAFAVLVAGLAAAYVAVNINEWQGEAQYRESLNEERRRVYPRLIRWTDQMSASVDNMKPGSSPDPVILDCYAQLWCCASPNVLLAVTKLEKALADLKQQPTEDHEGVGGCINEVREQVRWDLFGAAGFEGSEGQKVHLNIKSGGTVTYGLQDYIEPAPVRSVFYTVWRKVLRSFR
jgi:hypothetical protein